MSIELETPWAGLVALTAVVPVAVWVLGARRSASVRHSIGLGPPPRRGSVLLLGALVLAIALLGLAAAQPVVASPHRSAVRRDADVFVVLDTSRSMLASRAPETPTRFDRARAIARALDKALPAAAVGIASMTDRVLPHLFPTVNQADFDATLDDAIGVQRPPPAEVTRASGTDLGSLGELALAHFFPPGEHVRVAVVLTDGESRGFPFQPVATALRRARIQLVLIRLGSASERVFAPSGRPEAYRPVRGTGVEFARTALLLRASAYAEPEAQAAIAEVARAVADGGGVARHSTTSVRELSLPLAVAALLPVLFLLWRRNVR